VEKGNGGRKPGEEGEAKAGRSAQKTSCSTPILGDFLEEKKRDEGKSLRAKSATLRGRGAPKHVGKF